MTTEISRNILRLSFPRKRESSPDLTSGLSWIPDQVGNDKAQKSVFHNEVRHRREKRFSITALKKILLIGGTAETAALAEALVAAGCEVIVSLATRIRLNIGRQRHIRGRRGRLDPAGLRRLAQREKCAAIVCAAHPYAVLARAACVVAAGQCKLPLYIFDRPALAERELAGCVICRNHAAAAKKAFQLGRRVLLTTGSRHLAPYVREAQKTGGRLVARVLPDKASLSACQKAGLKENEIITGRGPFSLKDNLADIRRHEIQALVTKNSGAAGGMKNKIIAARRLNCRVVVVARPQASMRKHGKYFHNIAQLVKAITGINR